MSRKRKPLVKKLGLFLHPVKRGVGVLQMINRSLICPRGPRAGDGAVAQRNVQCKANKSGNGPAATTFEKLTVSGENFSVSEITFLIFLISLAMLHKFCADMADEKNVNTSEDCRRHLVLSVYRGR